MFEIGRTYLFTFLSADERGTYHTTRETWVIGAIEGNLLKLHAPEDISLKLPSAKSDPLSSHRETKIINTASPLLQDATLQPNLIEEIAKAMAESSRS